MAIDLDSESTKNLWARLAAIDDAMSGNERKSAFLIGSTKKVDRHGLYFTPIRVTDTFVVTGAIVHAERQAVSLAKLVDGKVGYVVVDAEKKISSDRSIDGVAANIERAVREVLEQSALWVYKGNDLSVDSVDALVTQLTKASRRGLGGKKIAIIGCGNLGSKVALRLVERGADVVVTRRNQVKLELIVDALNVIKPESTMSEIRGESDKYKAAVRAELLIGLTPGIPVIDAMMIESLAQSAVVIDGGKGTVTAEGIKRADDLGVRVFRLDIDAALQGLLSSLHAAEITLEQKTGRSHVGSETLVSGGLLGRENEIVVDNCWAPSRIYGIANGVGDFIRDLSIVQEKRLIDLKRHFLIQE